jgi:hypothetical protein
MSTCPISLEPIPEGHAITLSGTTFDVESILGLLLVTGSGATHPHTREPFKEEDLRSVYAVALINSDTRKLLEEKEITNVNGFLSHLCVSGEARTQEVISSSLQQAYETSWGALIDRVLYENAPVYMSDIVEILRVFCIANRDAPRPTERAVKLMLDAIDRRLDELIHGGALIDDTGFQAYARLERLKTIVEDIQFRPVQSVPSVLPIRSLLQQVLSSLVPISVHIHEEEGEAEDEVGEHPTSEVQAPAASEVQSPAASEVQAPAASEVQSPAASEVQAPAASEVQVPELAHVYLQEWHTFLSTFSSETPSHEVIFEHTLSTCAVVTTVLRLTNGHLPEPEGTAYILKNTMDLMLEGLGHHVGHHHEQLIQAQIWKINESVLLNSLLQRLDESFAENIRDTQPLITANLMSDSPMQNAIIRLLQNRAWALVLQYLKLLKILNTPSFASTLQYVREQTSGQPVGQPFESEHL